MGRNGLTAGALALVAAAAAAVLFLEADDTRRWLSRQAPERAEVAELIGALATEPGRRFQGRLAGFPHAPVAVLTRGARGIAAPDVRIAAATIEKRGRVDETPQQSAAMGAAHLALGEWDKAVAALRDAVEAAPDSAIFLNDLAVALLARAAAADRPEDWIGALDASSRAIRIDPARAEPRFNRALALGGLHLGGYEADAWAAYPEIDARGPWSEEAAAKLAEVRRRKRYSPSDPGVFDHQSVRERIEDHLLRDWGAAIERGDRAAAAGLLEQAGELAGRLAASGGDAMARDEIAHIRSVLKTGDDGKLRALATAHRLYGQVRELWLSNRWAEADALMIGAAESMRRSGSLYWQWSHYFHAAVLALAGDQESALQHLRALPMPPPDRHYYNLRARLAWTEGFQRANQGRFDLARGLMASAVDEFRSAGEYEHLAATQSILAESEWYLGDAPSAWSNLLAALDQVDRRGESRRTEHYQLAASIAKDEGLYDAALVFDSALADVIRSPLQLADIQLRRAQTRLRLGDAAAAAGDLDRASASLAEFGASVIRDRLVAEIELVRAELFRTTDCQRTMSHSAAALPYFSSTRLIALGSLLRTRAMCLESLGDLAAARSALRDAVQVYEERLASLPTLGDRARALELERATFRDLLALEVVDLDDEISGFETAERGRAGAVAESWRHGPAPDPGALPPGVAVIYYESLPDRVLVWVLTRERRRSFSRPIGDAALRRAVQRIRAAIDRGADLAELRRQSGALFDALIAPALQAAAVTAAAEPAETIVFVPDGALFALPFGALPDAAGRPLIAAHQVAVAPSLRTLLAASARLATFTSGGVLAIGDGHDAAASGLPRLPRADEEVAGVGRLYARSTVLTGRNATRSRVLGARAAVIHFAGHTVVNERYPTLSRMLLAPEPGGGEPGWLLGSDITSERFGGVDVVVLASCEGAAGRVIDGEGALSVGRAFFTAGVPAVVASLWAVDDDLQTLTTTFHRALVARRDPAAALRQAQLALLAERGPRTPVRVWGGFIMFGGLRPAGD